MSGTAQTARVSSKTALRRVPVGTLLEVTHYRWPDRMNGLRRIVKVQTNAWAMRFVEPTEAQREAKLADRDLWMYWEKTRCVFDEAGFTVYQNGEDQPLVRYEWRGLPEGATA